jgi:hypothetical protein
MAAEHLPPATVIEDAHSWPKTGKLCATAQNEVMISSNETAALVLSAVVIDFDDTRIDGLLIESHVITKTESDGGIGGLK